MPMPMPIPTLLPLRRRRRRKTATVTRCCPSFVRPGFEAGRKRLKGVFDQQLAVVRFTRRCPAAHPRSSGGGGQSRRATTWWWWWRRRVLLSHALPFEEVGTRSSFSCVSPSDSSVPFTFSRRRRQFCWHNQEELVLGVTSVTCCWWLNRTIIIRSGC